MARKGNLWIRFALASTSWLAILPSQALAQAAGGTGRGNSEPATLQEVVVTAQRREENIQRVPITITAMSAERLQQQNILKPQDLQASVPSLVVGPNGEASRDTQSFTIRGLGATFQASPGVVVYLNEVPLPAPITLSQQGGPGNFIDLENLQVLAGPQGTLFGRNTTGGAVLLVPHKPTNEFEGELEGKLGNFSDHELQGVLNIPVIKDKLLVRAVGAWQERDGYTRDLTFNRNLDNEHWYSGRLGVTFRPTEALENYFLAYGAYSRFNGTGQIHRAFNIDGFKAIGFCADPTDLGPVSPIAVNCSVYRDADTAAAERGPRTTEPGVDQFQKTETWGVMNTLKYDISDELTVRNILSFQKFRSFNYYDADGTPIQQYDAAVRSSPFPRDSLKDFTAELQLQGNALDKKLIYTVGAFYYDQKPDGTQGNDGIVYCPALFTGFCVPQRTFIGVENESTALYAQATLDFGAFSPAVDGLRLTAGYRYTWDRIDGEATSFTQQEDGSFLCANSGALVLADPEGGCRFSGHLRSEAPSWTVGLDYRPISNLLTFAKVSRGYKSGGFNTYAVFPETRTFDPEFVTSYEVGAKSDFRVADVPVRLNATYYYSKYSNIQRAAPDFNADTNASGARVLGAKARIQGVELEATMRPVPMLEIGGTFSYTDAKYTNYVIPSDGIYPDCSGSVRPPGEPANITCLPFQYVAPYIYNVHATLNFPIPERLGELALFVNYSHTAAQHTEVIILPPNQPGEELEAFGLLNASLDWTHVGGSNADVGLFVTNATDSLFRISSAGTYQIGSLLTASDIYGEPRMFGVRVRYHFGP